LPRLGAAHQSHKNQKRQFDNFDFCDFGRSDVLPEPNFPIRPDEFVGRRQQIEVFRQVLRQGLAAGRTSSFAILGDWGIGKSSLLLKFAAVCSEPAFAILPVLFSASSDIHDYLRLAESLLDKFGDALLAVPNLQARLRTELRNWKFRRLNFGAVGLERQSPPPVPQFRKFSPQTYAQGSLGSFLPARTVERRSLLHG
jgi:hypothetical protein